MPTPSIQTLRADAQQVLNLDSISAVRSVVAATLANANAGTPLNPNLTTQQLWNEFYQIVTQPKSDIESIIANQLMKFLYAPPAPGGAGADKQVIFNDGGVLAGDPQFLWNKTTNLLTVTGSATITGAANLNGAVNLNTAGNSTVLLGSSAGYGVLSGSGTNAASIYINGATRPGFNSVLQFGAAEHQWYNSSLSSLIATLNTTGLGVGKVPASNQSKVQIYQALGTSLNGALHITDDATTSFVFNNTSSGVSSIWTSGVLTFSTGSNAYSTNGARMTLDASGNLLVARTGAGLDNTSGVTLAQASIGMQTEGNAVQLIMNRTTSDGAIVGIRRNNLTVGDISVTTTGTTYNTISDYRLKESVQPLVGGLARISALKPSVYKWKADGSNGEGFLAHELAEVVPLAVTGEKDAVNEDGSIKAQGVDLSKVVPILVAAIQELTARVQTLEAK